MYLAIWLCTSVCRSRTPGLVRTPVSRYSYNYNGNTNQASQEVAIVGSDCEYLDCYDGISGPKLL